MIFGYISKKGYPRLESYLEEHDPKGMMFRYTCGERKAYFFRGSMDLSLCPIYYDSNSLMLCEGIPIRGSPDNGYEQVDVISEEDIKKGFSNFINEIVSNVSMVFFKNDNNEPKLYFSSNRVAAGRIYYRYIDKGIAFSSSFLALLRFAPSKINYEAIYSILKYGFVSPPLTLSKDVYVVPPAHYTKVSLSNMKIFHYSYFKFCFLEEHGFDLNRLDDILNAISKVLNQLNCSLLLSGGVDSTLLAHKMRERSDRKIRSYFLALNENDPELSFAKKASKSSNSQLDVIYMNESRLSEIIDEIAISYDHPFNDFSTIPMYYLMKCLVSKEEEKKIIIDGTGGDGSFGFGTITSDKKFWMFAYGLPRIVKEVIYLIYSHSDIWKKKGILEKIFRTIVKCREGDINLGPLVLCPPNDVFFFNVDYDKSKGRLLMNLVSKLINPCFSGQIFKQRATVTDIIYACGARMAAKTYLREKFPQVYTLYPYLWKDILEEQGKISWSAKVNNGLVKWPLKKLIEPYMPHYFIYRNKSGLTPELENYFKNQKVYNLLIETFMNQNIFMGSFVNKNKFTGLLKNLPTIERYSLPLCHLLWGLLFIDLWVSKHQKLFTHR